MEVLAMLALSVFGFLSIIWGLAPEWGKKLTELLLYAKKSGDISSLPGLTELERFDQGNKLKEGKKTPSMRAVAFIVGLVFLGLGVTSLIYTGHSDGSSSSTWRHLSESTQRKIFYDMIATQDQNPYSNEWDQGVKQAAADHYNIPMSQISNIIQRGATEGWLQPDPP